MVAAAVLLPFVVLTAWMAAVAIHASVVVNGERCFYLDDAQMVAMRYGRNLAEGRGFVWNAGERVEGYSNPGWVLVMAAVHAAGAPDRLAPLAVKVIAWLLACAVLLLAARLRQRLAGPDAWADAAVLSMLAFHADLVFWAANGFETTLLTAGVLWLVGRVVDESAEGGARSGTLVAAGGLALVRSDAHLLVGAVALVALMLSPRPARTGRLAFLALAIPAAHLAARLAYYGEWVPNTFYLRLWDVPTLGLDGWRYAVGFGREHVVLVVLAVVAAARPDRRTRALLGVCVCAGLHGLAVGGDVYEHHRFVAPAVPIMIVLAAVATREWTGRVPVVRAVALAALVAVGIGSGGMVSRWPVDAMRSWRQRPWQGAAIGRVLQHHTSPSASVAAVGGGALGYFSHRTVIDFAGRTDPVVARLRARPGADPGARKFDIDHSLARRPDFVVTNAPYEETPMFMLRGADVGRDIVPAVLASDTFLREYRGQPVGLPLLMERSAMFVRADSPERPGISAWRLESSDFR